MSYKKRLAATALLGWSATGLVLERPIPMILPHAQAGFGSMVEVQNRRLIGVPGGLCKAARQPDMLVDNVALVSRGGCNFTTKVLLAQAAGAVGAVITDTENKEQWAILMSGGSDEERDAISIPSVFVSLPSGKVLWDSVAAGETRVTLNGTGQVIRGKVGPLETLAIYLVVSLVLLAFSGFCGLFLALGVQSWQRRYRTLALRALRRFHYRREMADPSNDRVHTSCSICLDDYDEGDELTETPCKHAFHHKCVSVWLQTRSSLCPLCKADCVGAAQAKSLGADLVFDELRSFCRDSLRLVVVVVASVVGGAVVLGTAAFFQQRV